MKRNLNKLVRDNIPDIIKADGGVPSVRVLDDGPYTDALFDKLLEEAEEVRAARGDMSELEKEIGDVYEVIDAIVAFLNLEKEAILEIKEKRLAERGGFSKRFYLEAIS